MKGVRTGITARPQHESENASDVREMMVQVGEVKKGDVKGEEIRGMGVFEDRKGELGLANPEEGIHEQITRKGVGNKGVVRLQVVISLKEHGMHTCTPQQEEEGVRVCV